MVNRTVITVSALASSAFLTFGACNRAPRTPELTTTSGAQPTAEPISVTGCLKKGVVAENTFVLLVSKADGSGPSATYELIPRPGVDLTDRVGQEVQVSGTLRSREEVTSTSGPTRESAAKGTAGTPAVETKTDLDVRRLDAATVTGAGAPCRP